MLHILGGEGSHKETVFIENPFNLSKTLLDIVKQTYEQKVIRNAYILEVTKIIDESEYYISKDSNKKNTLCDVVFECLVDRPMIGDIIINCVCYEAGRAKEIVKFTKGNYDIMAVCNNNIDQVIVGQVMTIKIKDITWEPLAKVIGIRGTFNHAHIFASLVYRVNVKDVLAHKALVKTYTKKINELMTSPLDPKMVDLVYPFYTPQSKLPISGEVVPFGQIMDEILRGVIIDDFLVVKSCFLTPGFVMRDRRLVYQKVDTYSVIRDIYDSQIKYIEMIKEMEEEYGEINPHLLTYYKVSKKMNDTFIDKLAKGLEMLRKA